MQDHEQDGVQDGVQAPGAGRRTVRGRARPDPGTDRESSAGTTRPARVRARGTACAVGAEAPGDVPGATTGSPTAAAGPLPDAPPDPAEGPWPLWRLALLGWLAAAALVARLPDPTGSRLGAEAAARAPVWDLGRLSARELRALPAVGPARAVDWVEARWHAPPDRLPALVEVPGIGPATAAEVERFLAERTGAGASSPDPGRTGATTPAAPGPGGPVQPGTLVPP